MLFNISGFTRLKNSLQHMVSRLVTIKLCNQEISLTRGADPKPKKNSDWYLYLCTQCYHPPIKVLTASTLALLLAAR